MFLLGLILNKVHYHRVPPCPKCGSKKTGRFLYVSNTRSGVEKVIGDCMAKGELVQLVPSLETVKYENAYCEDCGCEWHANIETFWLSKENIAKERYERGITKEKYKNIKEIKSTTRQRLKEERKKRKAEKKKQKEKTRKILH
jgi:hypothetical protein